MQALLLGVWVRVLNVAVTAAGWVLHDIGPGLRDIGVGLARAVRGRRPGLSRAGWGVFDMVTGAAFGLVSFVPQVVGLFRPLTASELEAGRAVYADTIAWSRVRVYPRSYVAATASRMRSAPTAVVTMWVVHVPASFDTSTVRGQAWLVHELMHVWQGQHTGPSAMARAIVGQLRGGYAYGGEPALRRHATRGLAAFNLEQQAEIMRGFFRRLVAGGDVSAYLPYVEEVRRAGRPRPAPVTAPDD